MKNNKQRELDDIKWKASEAAGRDLCGEFDFCVKCDKSLENACEKAYNKFHRLSKKQRPQSKRKITVDGREYDLRCTVVDSQ
jgi:hypothetical protein